MRQKGPKERIAIFYGGPGNEASVSALSASNVLKALRKTDYSVRLIFWSADRRFFLFQELDSDESVEISPLDFRKHFDIALPMTHGRYGEDGCLQGLFEALGVAYAGSGVLSSALCMDKAIFKDYVSGRGFPVLPYVYADYLYDSPREADLGLMAAAGRFAYPVFVKPANSGSSVGITKVRSAAAFKSAIKEAKRHDSKVILEKGLEHPREIEIAVLGNDKLTVSRAGELILASEYYGFDDKYVKGETRVDIPADLPIATEKTMREMAAAVYSAVGCHGFARVDFFLDGKDIYLNEINTLPGFTDISMYPMLMKKSGISYPRLIERIIKLVKH